MKRKFESKETLEKGELRSGIVSSGGSKSVADNEGLLYHFISLPSEVGPSEVRKLYEHHWYVADIKGTSNSFRHFCTMPIGVPDFGTPVILGSYIYYLGGIFFPQHKLWKMISRHFNSPKVFVFDTRNPNKGWIEGPSMIAPRRSPVALSFEGRIYVFSGHDYIFKCPIAEVFDPISNSWEPLPDPPIESSYTVIPSVIDGHIFIYGDGSEFCSFDLNSRSWGCVSRMDFDFDDFFFDCPAVFVDNLLCSYNPQTEHILGIDFVSRSKWSIMFDRPNKPVSDPENDKIDSGFLVCLKNGNMCLIWWDRDRTISVQEFKIQGHTDTFSLVMGFSTSFLIKENEFPLHVLTL